MPFRRIGDLPPDEPKIWKSERKQCFHPEHDPPKHISLRPGIYEYECPGCGEKKFVTIRGGTFDLFFSKNSGPRLSV